MDESNKNSLILIIIWYNKLPAIIYIVKILESIAQLDSFFLCLGAYNYNV